MFSAVTFLFKYWRETLIGLGFIFTGLFVIDYVHSKKEIGQLEYRLEQSQGQTKELQNVLDGLEVKSKEQEDRLKSAETERAVIIKKMALDINTLRNQRPPKDCTAIDWAIKNKGDLAWPTISN